jgi:hypothetical protein
VVADIAFTPNWNLGMRRLSPDLGEQERRLDEVKDLTSVAEERELESIENSKRGKG